MTIVLINFSIIILFRTSSTYRNSIDKRLFHFPVEFPRAKISLLARSQPSGIFKTITETCRCSIPFKKKLKLTKQLRATRKRFYLLLYKKKEKKTTVQLCPFSFLASIVYKNNKSMNNLYKLSSCDLF